MTEAQHAGELLLVWKQPQTRQRFLIGRLWKAEDGYHFAYEQSVPRSVLHAQSAGFHLLEAFPMLDDESRSSRLFPTFRRRVVPSWRSRNLKKVIGDLDFSRDEDVFEFLRITGGRLPTDTLEFLEPGEYGVQDYHFRFPVAGWRYYEGEQVLCELSIGERVRLELEPDNEWDPNAVRIFSPSGKHIGYVPAIYSWYLEDAVKAGTYDAVITGVSDAAGPQRRVQISVTIRFGASKEFSAYRLVPSRIVDFAETLVG